MPGRRDKPRQTREVLATLPVAPRVTISFQGGPLAGIVLDSQSANESERRDVAWLIVKTRSGQLGERFKGVHRLHSRGGLASAGEYEVRGRAENAEHRELFLVYNAGPGAASDQPRG